MASRRDAWPPNGGTPASDLDFLRFQLLDNYGTDIGVLNPLQPSGQGDRNNAFSAAMAHAVNEWQLEHWLRKEPRLRGSIVVPYEDPAASAAEIRKRAGDPRFLPGPDDEPDRRALRQPALLADLRGCGRGRAARRLPCLRL
ncbi:amidohydrolase family protein [Dankookia sp. P2]|uniref:amidohydrolase family protein n=1 Tax=Dankookia sp. P2 TaxID=3423955 RepID=UPI003D664C6E